MSRNARGQSLVLWALSLFLITLMVTVTLGIGARTRERMELQVAADTAAFSQGVEVARAMNSMAVANRAQISLMVSLAGAQSLISWSGHYRSNLRALNRALDQAKSPYLPCCGNPFCPFSGCSCAELGIIGQAQAAVAAEEARVSSQWEQLDDAAGKQVELTQRGAAGIGGHQLDHFRSVVLGQVIEKQASVAHFAKLLGPDVDAPARGDRKSLDEIDGGDDCVDDGALCGFSGEVKHSVQMTMGTRGWGFTTSRRGGEAPIRDQLWKAISRANPGAGISPAAREGGSTFGQSAEHQSPSSVSNVFSWAHDHGGTLSLSWPSQTGCFSSGGSSGVYNSFVVSTDQNDGQDHHFFEGQDRKPARSRHTLIDCGNACPSVWPAFFDYNFNQVANAANDFGQPKLYAFLRRDYAKRPPDPWNLLFNFRFTQKGETFDNGSAHGDFRSPSGGELRDQVAVGAALVYYHRPGAWHEPPNLFNPFWRATLVLPDEDLPRRVREAGFKQYGDTLQRLAHKGFRGAD